MPSAVSVKVAPRALLISLALWERVGVRETIMGPTTYIFRGGVGTMIVRQMTGQTETIGAISDLSFTSPQEPSNPLI